jgi:hypothetical protein
LEINQGGKGKGEEEVNIDLSGSVNDVYRVATIGPIYGRQRDSVEIRLSIK